MLSLHSHGVCADILNRYANIVYFFDFENENKFGSNELKFEISIDADAFISKFEANIDGDIFIGETKEKQTASNEYIAAKEKDENAILISQPHKNIPNVFEIKTNIDCKSKISLSITIQQYLQKKFDLNELNIQILKNFKKYNINTKYNSISFEFNISDISGIYDIKIPSSSSDTESNKIVITEWNMDKLNENCIIKGEMSNVSHLNELILKYKIKGETNDSHIIFDNNSNTFCHIISDIITHSKISNSDKKDKDDDDEGDVNDIKKTDILIPRRVIFIIDRSGSMRGDKWDKTISSTIMALKQLRTGYDKFCVILFDDGIEILPGNHGKISYNGSKLKKRRKKKRDKKKKKKKKKDDSPPPPPPPLIAPYHDQSSQNIYHTPSFNVGISWPPLHYFGQFGCNTFVSDQKLVLNQSFASQPVIGHYNYNPANMFNYNRVIIPNLSCGIKGDVPLPPPPKSKDNVETLMSNHLVWADQQLISNCIEDLKNKKPDGRTNINDALLTGIKFIKADIQKGQFFVNQLIFITDGKPNGGVSDTTKIIMNVKEENDLRGIDKYNNKISIFSFGVGKDGNDSGWINDLNHSFLKILAVNNDGFYKRIKKSTADIALKEYFTILSNPLLTNICIEYNNNKIISDLTQTSFHSLYSGNDIIVCGKINSKHNVYDYDYNLKLTVSAMTAAKTGPINIWKEITLNLNTQNIEVEQGDKNNNAERIWAYLKLQQMAKQKLIHNDMIEIDDDEQKQDDSTPLSLALKYKFVTPWTSMIVVKKKEKEHDDKTITEIKQDVDVDVDQSLQINDDNKNVSDDHVHPTTIFNIDINQQNAKTNMNQLISDDISNYHRLPAQQAFQVKMKKTTNSNNKPAVQQQKLGPRDIGTAKGWKGIKYDEPPPPPPPPTHSRPRPHERKKLGPRDIDSHQHHSHRHRHHHSHKKHRDRDKDGKRRKRRKKNRKKYKYSSSDCSSNSTSSGGDVDEMEHLKISKLKIKNEKDGLLSSLMRLSIFGMNSNIQRKLCGINDDKLGTYLRFIDEKNAEKQPSNEIKKQLKKCLCKDILFININDEMINTIIDSMYCIQIPKNEYIVKEGEYGDTCFVLESGEFDKWNGQNPICVQWLLYSVPSKITIRAKQDCVVWALNIKDYQKVRYGEIFENKQERLELIIFGFIRSIYVSMDDFSMELMKLIKYWYQCIIICGELCPVLRWNERFNEKIARFYIGCIVLEFERLHQDGIIYKDLKPENIFIDNDGYCKLMSCCSFEDICGTPQYLAPELIIGSTPSFAVDYWTLGILIYELVVGYVPFKDDDTVRMYQKILSYDVEFPCYPQRLTPRVEHLISGLLEKNSYKRLGNNGIQQIINHPWFSGFNWDQLRQKTADTPFVNK